MKSESKFDNPSRFKAIATLRKIMFTFLLLPIYMVFPGASGANPIIDASTGTEGAGQGTEGQSTTPNTSVTEQNIANEPNPTGDIPPQEPVQQQPPQQEPQAGNDVFQKLGLTKFNDVESLAKSYINIEQLHSRTANEKAQLQAQLDNLNKELETLKQSGQQSQQQQQPPPEQTKSPEEIEEENLRLAEELINNPLSALEKIKADIKKELQRDVEAVKKEVEPIITEKQQMEQQAKWNQTAAQFAQATDESGNLLHPEISRPEIREAMVKAFETFPGLSERPDALDVAYKYAIGEFTKSVGNTPAIEPDKLLEDENFLQIAASNQKIMEIAQKKYLESIKSGSPPPIMGAQTGGAPAALPDNKPKTLSEGSNLLRKLLGIG